MTMGRAPQFFWLPRAAVQRLRAAPPPNTVRVLMTSVIEMPGDAVAASASGHKYRYAIILMQRDSPYVQ